MLDVFDGVLPTAEERNKYYISDTDVSDLEQFVRDTERNKELRAHIRFTMRKLCDEQKENQDLYEKCMKLEEENEKLKEDIERLA
jgi:hypothetical protein